VTQGFILKFTYVLCTARALGNSQEGSRCCCPRGIPPTKGSFYTLLRSNYLCPMQHFQGRGSCGPMFLSPASSALPELPLGNGGSWSQDKAAQCAAVTCNQTRTGDWLAQTRGYRKLAPNLPCLTSHLLVLCQAQHV